MMSIVLTTKEIYELATFAGLLCGKPDDEMAQTELTIDFGDVHDDGRYGQYSGPRAHFTDYPEEGYIPLGEIPE